MLRLARCGVPTPIIDAIIVLAGAMHKKSFFDSKYTLDYLGIGGMGKGALSAYLNGGFRRG